MALREKTAWYSLGSFGVRSNTLARFLLYDGGTTNFTDETTDMSSTTASDVVGTGFGDIGDMYYWGANDPFDWMYLQSGNDATIGTGVFEYWNGTAWTTFVPVSEAGSLTLRTLLTTPLQCRWAIPSNWATTTVNGFTHYWIRFRVTTAYTVVNNFSLTALPSRSDYATKTVYLPETTSRTIKNVTMFVAWRTAGASTIGRVEVDARMGANAYTRCFEEASDITTTGEHQAPTITVDLTDIFVAQFGAGASQTLDVRVLLGNLDVLNLENVTAWFLVTYVAEEQSTRLRTVPIPIQSNLTALTTALVELGSNEVPALDTYLPEAGKVYRDIFFLIEGNTASGSTVASSLGMALDAEAETLFTFTTALTTATYENLVWQRNDLNTAVAHQIKARTTNVASLPWRWLTITMFVTYEYDHDSSTRVMNAVMMPALEEPGYTGDSASDPSRAVREFFVQEPNPTLEKAAVLMSFGEGASVGVLNVQANGSGYTGYTHASTAVGGGWTLMHKITAAMSLVRGRNTVTIDWYTTVVDTGSGFTGMLIINYSSDKHSAGDGAHNRTIWRGLLEHGITAKRRASVATAIDFPSTNYYLTAVGFELLVLDATIANPFALTAELLPGEGEGEGWVEMFSQFMSSDAERGLFIMFARGRDQYRRWPTDPDSSRMDVKASRRYRVHAGNLAHYSLLMFVTYHTISYTFSGSVTQYTGDGSGITVEIFRALSDEKVGEVVTAVGGGYSFTWYDNTEHLYAVARQDATHVGRSENALAV